MKNLNIALRSLFKKGRSNGIKILSLGVGLAMGLVLISKVCFERSFDKFYPDSDRIYRLHENIIRDGEYKSYGQVSGGVATAMQVEIPEVEKATRLTYIGGDKELFKTQDGNRYSARYVVMGDTNVFDLLPRPILIGDPKETLSRPGYVMISNRIAKLLGGAEQAVNKEFEFESSPGQTYTIGGVFEDVPENSHLRFEIVASLEGMSKWSRENWLGNDRYLGYVKLYPGTDPESLTTAIREMQGRHCDLEEVKKAGIDLTYSLVPLMDMHSNSDEVKSMNSLLGFLAFVLIFTAAMNFKAEGGGVPMAPAASACDGKLSFCEAAGIPKWRTFLCLPFLVAAKHTSIHGFSVTDAKDCTIRLSRPMVVHADGEYCGEVTEVHFHCLPGKLRVLK